MTPELAPCLTEPCLWELAELMAREFARHPPERWLPVWGGR